MFVETQTLLRLLPEIFLVLLATWIFVAGAFYSSQKFWSAFAVASFLVAGFALYQQDASLAGVFAAGEILAPSGPVVIDYLSQVARWLALVAGLLITLMASHGLRPAVASELLGLVMLATAGVMLVTSASELVLLFLALELISIPTYVLLYIGRPGRPAAEATTKYFFLSILSSALLLYGFSFLYGMTGTTDLIGDGAVPGMHDILENPLAAGVSPGLFALAPLALLLIFAGLGFRIAAVPFHFYAPDVYQGTTNANAGLLAVFPKIAGTIALVRLLIVTYPVLTGFAWQAIVIVAMLTMTLGNVCALWQTNLRRMLAYSSIAHAGYLLIGLAVALRAAGEPSWVDVSASLGGISALVLYLVVYAFGALGAFAVLAHLGSQTREIDKVDELSGLGKTHPIAAALLALFMFSLAGIPPLAGFWGKLDLFSGAVRVYTHSPLSPAALWYLGLAIVAALNTAIAAAYYLRVVGALYFRPSVAPLHPPRGAWALTTAVICSLVIIVVGLDPSRLVTATRRAEHSALQVPKATRFLAVDESPAEPLAAK
jgi:NADH-quinone oxidoreductase subunit N